MRDVKRGRKKITKYVSQKIYPENIKKKFMILEAIVNVLVVYVKCEFLCSLTRIMVFLSNFKYIKLNYSHPGSLLSFFDDDVN